MERNTDAGTPIEPKRYHPRLFMRSALRWRNSAFGFDIPFGERHASKWGLRN